ncbi:MAG: tetratricopeptide repeat protein [Alphaproteobacteria bacterium]|nr:tetratricopeptide repeat protein [Alphaproteobacteria bacterium]
MRRALAHHEAGELAAAERLYRDILKADPGHAGARQYLGVLAHQAGRTEEGIALVREALAAAPHDAGAHANLAQMALATGRLREAEVHARIAVALAPAMATAHVNLAATLLRAGEPGEARVHWLRALELEPRSPVARTGLAEATLATGAPDPAERAETLIAAGRALTKVGRRVDSAVLLRRATRIAPDSAGAHLALGTLLIDLDELDGATASLARAAALDPSSAAAHGNLGVALQEQGRSTEAIDAFATAGRLDPQDALAHWNRSLVLLRTGRWSEGFATFEWRWRLPGRAPRPGATWDGAPLDGRTLLLHAEQGMGDTIMCLRWLPAAVARARGRVLLAVQEPLQRLARATWPGLPLVEEGTPIPAHDVHLPLMSLPLLFGATPATLPPPVRFAVPPAGAAATAGGTADGERRIGLVWAGRPSHPNDARRSCPPGFLAPLAAAAGCRFFSLQVPGARHAPAATIADLPPALRALTTDLGPALGDMADTAAALAALELIITVDSAVAHLAATQGVPTWMLASFVADWRWLEGRADSPWYPSLRLFRQERPHDWPSAIAAVAAALAAAPAVP